MADWLDVSDQTPRVAYVATAAQTVFAVPFVFFSEADLAVYRNDVRLTLSTDYVTSGALDELGGFVTLNTGATLGDSVVITRDIAIELTTHIPPSGPLDIPAINLQLSKMVAMIQKVAGDRVRSLHQPDADAADIGNLPGAAARALAYLAFDAVGNPIAAVNPAAYPASFFMASVLAALDAASARTALGIADQTAYTGAFNHLNYR